MIYHKHVSDKYYNIGTFGHSQSEEITFQTKYTQKRLSDSVHSKSINIKPSAFYVYSDLKSYNLYKTPFMNIQLPTHKRPNVSLVPNYFLPSSLIPH